MGTCVRSPQRRQSPQRGCVNPYTSPQRRSCQCTHSCTHTPYMSTQSDTTDVVGTCTLRLRCGDINYFLIRVNTCNARKIGWVCEGLYSHSNADNEYAWHFWRMFNIVGTVSTQRRCWKFGIKVQIKTQGQLSKIHLICLGSVVQCWSLKAVGLIYC